MRSVKKRLAILLFLVFVPRSAVAATTPTPPEPGSQVSCQDWLDATYQNFDASRHAYRVFHEIHTSVGQYGAARDLWEGMIRARRVYDQWAAAYAAKYGQTALQQYESRRGFDLQMIESPAEVQSFVSQAWRSTSQMLQDAGVTPPNLRPLPPPRHKGPDVGPIAVRAFLDRWILRAWLPATATQAKTMPSAYFDPLLQETATPQQWSQFFATNQLRAYRIVDARDDFDPNEIRSYLPSGYGPGHAVWGARFAATLVNMEWASGDAAGTSTSQVVFLWLRPKASDYRIFHVEPATPALEDWIRSKSSGEK